MDQFRYIKIHSWIRGLGSHKVINQVGINHSGSKACVLPPPPPPRGPPEPQRFPTGYPNKNSNNRKIESARGTMGRGKRREPLLSLLTFHFPSCPGSLFLSPQPPYNTKRPLRRRGFIAFMVLGLRSLWYYVVIKVSTSHGFHRFPEFCDFKVSWFS